MAKERANNVRLPVVAARGLAAAAKNISLSLSMRWRSDGFDTYERPLNDMANELLLATCSERKRTVCGLRYLVRTY